MTFGTATSHMKYLHSYLLHTVDSCRFPSAERMMVVELSEILDTEATGFHPGY
jgi:hypothetical protein